MCGIICYFGSENATPLLLEGLKRLEYRGYDSAGVALIHKGDLITFKAQGHVNNLIEKVELPEGFVPEIGLAHTRWATHGEATETNAHPHSSNDGDIVGVHNGTIENYNTISKKLKELGYHFESATDTEVVINFIHWIREDNKLNLLDAVRVALPQITGTCVLVLYSLSENLLIAVNKGGQLCSGKGSSGYFIASDMVAFAGKASNTSDINHEQLLVIKPNEKPQLFDLDLQELEIITKKITVDISDLSLGSYPHFMLKEIFAQPEVISRALKGRFNFSEVSFRFGGLDDYWGQIKSIDNLTIIACGTSWHAGLLGKYWLERLAGLSVKVEYASEFHPCVTNPGDVIVGISQSGNTADTIAALELAKQRGATILGVVNTIDSTIAKITDAGVYTRAGTEIGVASTKAFLAQAVVFLLLALKLAKERNTISADRMKKIVDHLELLPSEIEKVLASSAAIHAIAKKYRDANNFLYLGKDFNFPIAMEGALKLKEISYIHAEGMSLGEMKHGPIALIDEEMPVVMIVTRGNNYGKIITNLQEIKARRGRIIALVNNNDHEVALAAEDIINVPLSDEVLAPLINVVALQLLAYHLANERGCDVDKPRNLAKSVTVK